MADTQKPINHETPTQDNHSFKRVEFHIAKKPPFNGFTKDDSLNLETLNPDATCSKNSNNRFGSGKKRDAQEMENGLDQELGFRVTFRRIGAGLENLGNTCFLNSVLQCLTYTEPLAAYLQSGKHQVTCRKSGFCALCAIQKHVSRALQLPGRSLAPKDFVSNLRCISRTFRNSRQEDAHEYMVNLLESMHKCCLPNGVPIESQSAYEKSLVHKIFGGQLRSQVKCMNCNYCSNKFDPFLDVSLEILKADSLYKAFANFTAKEQLDGGDKQYNCQECKQKVRALKQLTVYKAPNVLTVHLKRFGCHMSGQKIDKKIYFGPTLDLKPFVTGPHDGDLKYTLYGVLVHAGWSTHSGHYYCFVRTSSGMWYSLDDNRVYQVSEKKVFEQKAYMLFYFKDRNNFSSKRTMNVHQKEKNVMGATSNGPGGPREALNKTDLNNRSLNAQTSLKKTVDVAHQKENIVLNGTPNGPGAPGDAQMNTALSNGNGSLNAHISLANVGTERSLLSPVLPKETQTNTKPLVSTIPKEAHMKTGLNDGSLIAQKSLATAVIEGIGYGPVALKETQTNSNLVNGSLSDQKSSDIAGTNANGFITDTTEEPPVPKSIPEASEPEDHTKEYGGGESACGNSGGDGHMEAAIALLQTSGLPEMGGSMENKAPSEKPRKKVKKFLKGKVVSMKFSSNVLLGTSLNQRKNKKHKLNKRAKNLATENLVDEGLSLFVKIEEQETVKPLVGNGFNGRVDKDGSVVTESSSNVLMGKSLNKRKKKKHKRNTRVKNLIAQENVVNECSSSLVKIEAQETVKPLADIEYKERVNEDGAVLATSDCKTESQSNLKESNQLENLRSLSQKDLVHRLTRGIDDRPVPRWDEDESAPSQTFVERSHDLTIGYNGDDWDEEYDRGKRKKVKISKTTFDGRNSFQEVANARLQPLDVKQNLSKTPRMMMKKKNKHLKKSGTSI